MAHLGHAKSALETMNAVVAIGGGTILVELQPQREE